MGLTRNAYRRSFDGIVILIASVGTSENTCLYIRLIPHAPAAPLRIINLADIGQDLCLDHVRLGLWRSPAFPVGVDSVVAFRHIDAECPYN